MQHKHKLIVSTALSATLGTLGISVVRKYTKYVRFNYKSPLPSQHVEILRNFDDPKKIVDRLRNHCNKYRVVGFDCEWNSVNGVARPVALLQLATHSGLCVLTRLCILKSVPADLRLILEDENIIKVGVSPIDDAKYLARDYGIHVASTLDLRYLAESLGYKPSGLAKLAEAHLNVKMNKDWRIRSSDWEGEFLTPMQLTYAATDAHVAIELFKKFNGHSDLRLNDTSILKLERDIGHCQKYLNLTFEYNSSKVNRFTKIRRFIKNYFYSIINRTKNNGLF